MRTDNNSSTILWKRAVIILIAACVYIIWETVSGMKGIREELPFIKYRSQAMYDPSFYNEGRYPDLLLRLLVRGREVELPREVKPYSAYATYGHDEDEGNPFDSSYYKENDYILWLRQYASSVKLNRSLPPMDEVTERAEEYKKGSLDLGIANDMLRYSFALNKEEVQQASAFWYMWYYHAFPEKRADDGLSYTYPEIYVDLEGIEETGTVSAVWGRRQEFFLYAGGRH